MLAALAETVLQVANSGLFASTKLAREPSFSNEIVESINTTSAAALTLAGSEATPIAFLRLACKVAKEVLAALA